MLTRTNAGTPAGELLRRYWQLVALSNRVAVGGAPLAERVMGDDIVQLCGKLSESCVET
jgi:phthalate 4,5-dioxygenase oxygenase subunit